MCDILKGVAQIGYKIFLYVVFLPHFLRSGFAIGQQRFSSILPFLQPRSYNQTVGVGEDYELSHQNVYLMSGISGKPPV